MRVGDVNDVDYTKSSRERTTLSVASRVSAALETRGWDPPQQDSSGISTPMRLYRLPLPSQPALPEFASLAGSAE